jgi:hypothetical protein
MADLGFLERSNPVQIVGGDEKFPADVVNERGENRLLVKSASAPEVLGNIVFEYAEHDGLINLNVNGATTPQEFLVQAKPTDLIINTMIFECFCGNTRTDRFLDLNSELTNGLLVEVKSEDSPFSFKPIKRTGELDSLFSVGAFGDFKIIASSSGTYVSAKFGLSAPFIIKAAGSFAIDDFIKVTIRDNLSSINRIRFLAVGALDV